MTKLLQHSCPYSIALALDGHELGNITFFSKDNPCIHETLRSYLQYPDKEYSNYLTINDVEVAPKFRSQEKKEQFIREHLKGTSNFYVFCENNKRIHLYLYVDNENIKILNQSIDIDYNVLESTLSLFKYTNSTITVEIGGKVIEDRTCQKVEELDTSFYQTKGDRLYEDISKKIYIQKSTLLSLYNYYEIRKRKTPLVQEPST